VASVEFTVYDKYSLFMQLLLSKIILGIVGLVFLVPVIRYSIPRHIVGHAIERPYAESDLLSDADLVIQGTVQKGHPKFMSAKDDETLMTEWTVDVKKVYRGSQVDTVQVSIPGGSIGALKVEQAGAAKVLPRSSAVMFLRWLPEHKTYVLLSQRSGYRQMKGAQIETGVGQVEALEAVEARLKQ
jgi:hypothetical protein